MSHHRELIAYKIKDDIDKNQVLAGLCKTCLEFINGNVAIKVYHKNDNVTTDHEIFVRVTNIEIVISHGWDAAGIGIGPTQIDEYTYHLADKKCFKLTLRTLFEILKKLK